MDKHNDQHPVYGDLALSAAEMIAEHTGDTRWLPVAKDGWVVAAERAQARRDHEEALYYAEFGILA